jgi:hypothetical protein
MDAYRSATSKDTTEDEKQALFAYKGSSHYRQINRILRGETEPEDDTPERRQYIADIREAMKKSFVPADTPVYRGLQASLEQLTGFADPKDAVGRCFVHSNFASVSRSRNVSLKFGNDSLLKFTLPAGSNGVVLGSQDGEREIVLPDNAVFRVMKVEPDKEGAKNLIHVQYLGTREDA